MKQYIKQQYPEFLEEVDISKVLYGINVLIATSLLAAIIIFLNGKKLQDRIFGLLLFIPPIAANSLAIANPAMFHYMWFGFYDILKFFSVFFFIPGLINTLYVREGQKVNVYTLVFIVILIIYLIPSVLVPLIVDGIMRLWRYSTVIFRIPKEPNYVWRDIVFPGSTIGFLLMFLGYGFKGIIQ